MRLCTNKTIILFYSILIYTLNYNSKIIKKITLLRLYFSLIFATLRIENWILWRMVSHFAFYCLHDVNS